MSLSPAQHPLRPASRPDGHALSGTGATVLRGTKIAHDEVAHDTLFPLPLTPFEQLLLLDEYPSYPAQFFCRLRFRGRIRQAPLTEALRVALARHPLLTAIVDETVHGRVWLPCLDSLPQLQWNEQEPAPAFPRAGVLDIRTRPGLSVAALAGATRGDLVLQFHHAACDGIGALDFSSDLLTAYANLVAGSNRYRFKPLDANRLRNRGPATLSGRQLFRWSMQQTPRWWSLWRFFRRQPVPVVPHRPQLDAAVPPHDYPEACVHHFSREESASLAALAHGSESSLNGLLMRDLFLALYEWRQQRGLPNDAWLRLMLPVNMRTPGDRRLPAANRVSAVFLDRCLSHGFDADVLLDEITRLLEDIKNHDLGQAWLLALPALERMPRAWARVRGSRRRCLYSALLSNIGPVLAASPLPRAERRLVVGDMTLEAVEFLPIARPLQCMGFGVSTYAGQLSLAMRYDSRVLAEGEAKEVLAHYVGALRLSISAARGR